MIHVKLDQYREKKTEEELYSDVNFITQDDASEFWRYSCHYDP